ncbi:hypothetical protein A6U87_05915 [Rhizobium sp. AC44/96]|nr:hypothetical protein A6U87_05915 [Rhizobium sp. AC44/96]
MIKTCALQSVPNENAIQAARLPGADFRKHLAASRIQPDRNPKRPTFVEHFAEFAVLFEDSKEKE